MARLNGWQNARLLNRQAADHRLAVSVAKAELVKENSERVYGEVFARGDDETQAVGNVLHGVWKQTQEGARGLSVEHGPHVYAVTLTARRVGEKGDDHGNK